MSSGTKDVVVGDRRWMFLRGTDRQFQERQLEGTAHKRRLE